MKRTLFFLLIIAGLLTIISGFGEAAHGHGGRARHHVIAPGFFILFCLVHLWTNRRAALGYLKAGKTAQKRG